MIANVYPVLFVSLINLTIQIEFIFIYSHGSYPIKNRSGVLQKLLPIRFRTMDVLLRKKT